MRLTLRNRSLWLSVALLVAGCTDLGAVRDFAHLSADTSDYKAIISGYSDYPARAARYNIFNPGEGDKRQQQAVRLLGLQLAVADYMDALGTLATDGTIALDTGPLVDSISKIGAFDTATADIIKPVVDALTRAILGKWRQDQVKLMIEQGYAPMLTVLSALDAFTRQTQAEDADELLNMAEYYDVLQKRSRDPAGMAAAREWREYRQDAVAAREPARKAYLTAIARIRSGMMLLYVRRNDLSVQETVSALKPIVVDLNNLAKQLKL